MKQIQPVNGYVLVKVRKAEDTTAGGIIIPDTAREKLTEGEVVNIAPGASDEIAVGDVVIYKEFSGTELSRDGEDYLLIQASDIIAKYVEGDAI